MQSSERLKNKTLLVAVFTPEPVKILEKKKKQKIESLLQVFFLNKSPQMYNIAQRLSRAKASSKML